jgi:hypothetical protein
MIIASDRSKLLRLGLNARAFSSFFEAFETSFIESPAPSRTEGGEIIIS